MPPASRRVPCSELHRCSLRGARVHVEHLHMFKQLVACKNRQACTELHVLTLMRSNRHSTNLITVPLDQNGNCVHCASLRLKVYVVYMLLFREGICILHEVPSKIALLFNVCKWEALVAIFGELAWNCTCKIEWGKLQECSISVTSNDKTSASMAANVV